MVKKSEISEIETCATTFTCLGVCRGDAKEGGGMIRESRFRICDFSKKYH